MREKFDALCRRLAARLAVLRGRDGLTTVEVLVILGVSVLILGGTYLVSKPAITSWWNDKIATLWQ